jgi:hypothetical protein
VHFFLNVPWMKFFNFLLTKKQEILHTKAIFLDKKTCFVFWSSVPLHERPTSVSPYFSGDSLFKRKLEHQSKDPFDE